MDPGSVAVLVPVKSFAEAKARLAPALDGPARADLARRMAETVLAATGPLPATVVCDDPAVRAWAEALGADVAWTPGLGLNGAIEAAARRAADAGARRVMVAHADLPLATDLAWVAAFDGVTLVPDRRMDGTNVACVPATVGFRFAYGPGSFGRHRAEAARLGLLTRLVADPRLGWDVDEPRDLDLPAGAPA
jgi:2-phospho-L-lactate/phosphoenolpyruvate guanylyltransferase